MWLLGLIMNLEAAVCDVRFINGMIWTDQEWSLEPNLNVSTLGCLSTMSEQISGIPGFRNITLSVGFVDTQTDAAFDLAQSYISAMAAAGVDAELIRLLHQVILVFFDSHVHLQT